MKAERKTIAKKIKSLEEYLQVIKDNCINQFSNRIFEESLDDVWFRGESKIHKTVIPSLFTGYHLEFKDGFTVFDEKSMIEMAMQYYPALFEHCNSAIDRLVTLQHYTLPTRLLDITKSPLVALYFACAGNENQKESGRVLFMKNAELESGDYINTLAMVAANTEDTTSIKFKDIIDCLKKKGINYGSDAELFEKSTKNYLCVPKYDNERIKRQQGAMIFSSVYQPRKENKEKYDSLCRKINEVGVEELQDIVFMKHREPLDDVFDSLFFEILPEYKQNILQDLDNCGINEAFVFPEPEHQMQYIKWHCARRNKWYY